MLGSLAVVSANKYFHWYIEVSSVWAGGSLDFGNWCLPGRGEVHEDGEEGEDCEVGYKGENDTIGWEESSGGGTMLYEVSSRIG